MTKQRQLLTDQFIGKYPDFPAHMNALGTFVFYRTYSRFLPTEGRRETWRETVRRAVEYNVGLGVKHVEKIGYNVDYAEFKKEAEEMFDSMFNLRQFLSGRTMWIGGGENEVAEKYPLANFNCSFINIRSWDDLGDLFYLLMVGTGVGFKATKEFANNLAPIRTNTTLINAPYEPVAKSERLQDTKITDLGNGYAKIYVGDSKEGWVSALRYYFDVLTKPEYETIHTVKISYNSVRPKGERLKTFGGTASGHEPLAEMFAGIDKTLKNQIDTTLAPIEVDEKGYGKVRPVHILDIGNLIGANVVVGGVRRTAEIFLFDADDYESMLAKYGINGIWTEEQLAQHKKVGELLDDLGIKPDWFDSINKVGDGRFGLDHRRMSNNSIAFTKQPSRKFLNFVFEVMQLEGEPGFINLEEAARRRLLGMGITNPSQEQLDFTIALIGLNPCAEILLSTYGVCNLTTINMVEFVIKDENGKYVLDVEALIEAQKRSARAGLRMTLAQLEIPHWNAVQERDRLLGTSLTGEKDALAKCGYTPEEEAEVLKVLGAAGRNEADRYAKEMRVSSPLLVTTVKPEGTISQVAGGVSSGLHYSHSPYYIRRIRINAADPLAQAVQELGWVVNPEVGTPGDTHEERLANARTLVIDFPVESGSSVTKDDVSAKEQFDTYFSFQDNYTEHNSSNTITVKPNEWSEVEDIVFNNWDNFVGVSFLSHDGGTYQLAPYEACSKETYEELQAKMTAFSPDILQRFETGEDADLDGADSCEGGACPIR